MSIFHSLAALAASLALLSLSLPHVVVGQNATSSNNSTRNATAPSLVIYTYPSLMSNTAAVGVNYDFAAAYSNFSGIPREQIAVIRMQSANLASYAIGYKAQGIPVAPDVVLGMNYLQQEQTPNSTWSTFTLQDAQAKIAGIANLENSQTAKPFDYSLTAIIYDPIKLPQASKLFPNQTGFSLQRLLDTGLISNLSENDPQVDTSGLDFLLWTIAEFGDERYNIKNQYTGTGDYGKQSNVSANWRAWWTTAFQMGVNVIPNWEDSFAQFGDPSHKDVGMINSYGTDPAYNLCQGYPNSITPLVSTINSTTRAWATVEVMSIVNQTTHLAAATNFVNWFFSLPNQNEIPLTNWQLPARQDAIIPDCFKQSPNILPESVNTLYNGVLQNQVTIKDRINGWVADWAAIYKNSTATKPTATAAPAAANATATNSTGKPPQSVRPNFHTNAIDPRRNLRLARTINSLLSSSSSSSNSNGALFKRFRRV